MATLRTVTVKAAGGDYSSLSAAVAAECASTNLVTLDRQLDIVCDAILDTTRVTIPSSCTTDATRYVRVVGPAHGGVLANAYRLHAVADFNRAMIVEAAYARLVNISVQHESTSGNTSSNDAALQFNPAGAAAELQVDSCFVLKSPRRGFVVETGVVVARNSVFLGASQGADIADLTGSGLSTYLYNCVFVGGSGAGLVKSNNGTTLAVNCYACSTSANAYLQSAGTLTRTTCASDDSTGSTGLQSIAYDATTFTNVTAGAQDFHLPSGSPLIGVGTDLTATANYPFSTDFEGDSRGSTWDVGADQRVVAATQIPVFLHHYRQQGIA